MSKTEVYSWRLSPERKAALEEEARRRETTVARILDEITARWLAEAAGDGDDEDRQRRLHATARKYVGALRGGRADRAESAREDLRTILARKQAQSRA